MITLTNETNYCDFQSVGTSYEVTVISQLVEIHNQFNNCGNEHVTVKKAVNTAVTDKTFIFCNCHRISQLTDYSGVCIANSTELKDGILLTHSPSGIP